MQMLFYQSEFLKIPLWELTENTFDHVAGRVLYSKVYRRVRTSNFSPSLRWIEQKRKIAGLLASEFLKSKDSSCGRRVFSVGAGLGIVEGELTELGYACDALECEQDSLCWIKEHHPNVRVLVGDGRYLPCQSESYDLVILSGVDYCFDREQYEQVLREMKRIVKPDGRVMNVCLSNLSLLGIVKGIARTTFSSPFRHLQSSERQIPWGYQRTTGEHIKIGRGVGLQCESVCILDELMNVKARRKDGYFSLSWPTLREDFVLMVFKLI